jgi:hypothetical protein
MILTVDSTKNLTSPEFLEIFSIEMWSDENIYLIEELPRADIPNYFYITAYCLQFETEFLMSGLTTLLSNSTAYNFINTLESFRRIESDIFVKCLQGIMDTLGKYGLSPAGLRERFLRTTTELPEYSIITMAEIHKTDGNLLSELKIYEDELFKIYPKIWDELENYLLKIRGK